MKHNIRFSSRKMCNLKCNEIINSLWLIKFDINTIYRDFKFLIDAVNSILVKGTERDTGK